MGVNRVFFSQEALDTWMDENRIHLEGETMSLNPDGQRFRLESAVYFISEVGGGGDSFDLVGKVKNKKQLDELGGELCADSVIIGDDAYEVIEGFVGELISSSPAIGSGNSMASATRAALGDPTSTSEEDIDPLTSFFLEKR